MIGKDKKLTLALLLISMRSIFTVFLGILFLACSVSSCRAKKVDCPAYGQKPVEKVQPRI